MDYGRDKKEENVRMKGRFRRCIVGFVVMLGVVAYCLSVSNYVQAKNIQKYGTEAAQSNSVVTIKDTTDWNNFASQCNSLNDYYAGTTVILLNDISFDGVSNDNYKRVGTFAGIFDGGGHTISGMLSTSYSGLFGTLMNTGIIKNVTVSNSTFQIDLEKVNSGAIACVNGGIVDNCRVKNTNIINNYSGYFHGSTGGVVGKNYNSGESYYGKGKGYGTIKNCMVAADVTVKGYGYVGGICGGTYDDNPKSAINNCVNMGHVEGGTAGGIAGYENSINNCYNVGIVTGTSSASAGGIAYNAVGVVWNCYCSNESAELPIPNAKQTSNKIDHFPLSEMKTQAFCDKLNANRGSNTDWYEWEITSEYQYPTLIKVKNIDTCNISIAAESVEYNGNEQTPAVTVQNGSINLVLNQHYTVRYDNNINVGTATVQISGTGMYCGTVEKTFIITKGTPTYTYTELGTKVCGDNNVNINVSANKGELGAITYISSDNSVITVSSSGLVSFVGPGKASVTVNSEGTANYNGVSFVVPVTVNPANPIVKLKSKSRKITINYSKVKGASGYEIQYSLKKNFKSGVKKYKIKKTKKTTAKLKKGKKYYVRVRAYTKADGTALYSQWIKQSVKIK